MKLRSRVAPFSLSMCLIYAFAFLSLVALLMNEKWRVAPAFSLSHSVAVDEQGKTSLTIYGEYFNPEVKGVLVKNLINEKALIWQTLADIPAKAVDANGSIALASFKGQRVVSLDLDDFEHPKLLGSITLEALVSRIKIVGDYALVGFQLQGGLTILDLKDLEDLKVVARFPTHGSVTSMAVDQNIVYYTQIDRGVGRIDLSADDPKPEALFSLDSPWKISLLGKRLAVGTTLGRVHLFELPAEGVPVEVGSLAYPTNVRGVALTEDALIVALGDNTLEVFDLSAWPKLGTSERLSLPGSPLILGRVPGQSKIAVSLVSAGVALIDIRQGRPFLIGHLKMPSTFIDLKLQQDFLIGTSISGLESFSLDEIVTGESAKQASEAMLALDSFALESLNGYVYGYSGKVPVALGKNNLKNFHLKETAAFVTKDGISIFEQREDGLMEGADPLLEVPSVRCAKFRDNYLYVTNGNNLQIFSGARPRDLVAIGELAIAGSPNNFAFLDSGYLLVTTGTNGVLVVDVNDPYHPAQVAHLVPAEYLANTEFVRSVLVDGQRAYFACGKGGVRVFDMSIPSRPELLQVVDTPGSAKRMLLYDKLLLVADGDRGIFMVDVEDPANALPIGSMAIPLRVEQFAVAGDHLIVSSHPGGTMQLPLPQRIRDLKVVNRGEVHFAVNKVEKGQYAYLYDERANGKLKISAQ